MPPAVLWSWRKGSVARVDTDHSEGCQAGDGVGREGRENERC